MSKKMCQMNIDEKINFYEERAAILRNIRDTEPKSLEEIICKKYIEIGSMTKVKYYLDEAGYKVPHEKVPETIENADTQTNIFAAEAQRMLDEVRRHPGWARR